MDTDRLYEFLVLARTLNFTQASELLNTSQPTLSRHIADLERELGVSLFERTTHSVSLTSLGRLLQTRSAKLVNDCGHAKELARARELSATGHLSVGCTIELSHSAHIRGFTRTFHERYPDVHINFLVITHEMSVDVLQELDVVFTTWDFAIVPEHTIKKALFRHSAQVYLPPNHPLLARATILSHELAGETVLVPYADDPESAFARNGASLQRRTRGRVELVSVHDLPTAILEVMIGGGILVGPRYVKTMMPVEIFTVGIRDNRIRFDENLYVTDHEGTGVALLFLDDFVSSHPKLRIPRP